MLSRKDKYVHEIDNDLKVKELAGVGEATRHLMFLASSSIATLMRVGTAHFPNV